MFRYGYDFAKPLKSFKLPSDYYTSIKHPLDIPEIRDRMSNGDYDENILLFERDVLLMFTNALCVYQRDMDIHGQAEYMINYAMELFTVGETDRRLRSRLAIACCRLSMMHTVHGRTTPY